MKLVVFAFLSLGVIAVTPIDSFSKLEKFLSTKTSTKDANADLNILINFLANCPDGLLHSDLCLIANNYIEPTTASEVCDMARLSLDCMTRAVSAYTSCAGSADASAAAIRLKPEVEAQCEALKNGASSVVTGLLAMIMVTCVHFFY